MTSSGVLQAFLGSAERAMAAAETAACASAQKETTLSAQLTASQVAAVHVTHRGITWLSSNRLKHILQLHSLIATLGFWCVDLGSRFVHTMASHRSPRIDSNIHCGCVFLVAALGFWKVPSGQKRSGRSAEGEAPSHDCASYIEHQIAHQIEH